MQVIDLSAFDQVQTPRMKWLNQPILRLLLNFSEITDPSMIQINTSTRVNSDHMKHQPPMTASGYGPCFQILTWCV